MPRQELKALCGGVYPVPRMLSGRRDVFAVKGNSGGQESAIGGNPASKRRRSKANLALMAGGSPNAVGRRITIPCLLPSGW